MNKTLELFLEEQLDEELNLTNDEILELYDRTDLNIDEFIDKANSYDIRCFINEKQLFDWLLEDFSKGGLINIIWKMHNDKASPYEANEDNIYILNSGKYVFIF